MPIDFEVKFRSVGLNEMDEPKVLKAILDARDESNLLSYVYIYGYSFKKNVKVLNICDHYIRNPVPGLTAVCMRVAIDYWNETHKYEDALENFLNIELFEEWYDEIIFTVGFINRNKENFPERITRKFDNIIVEKEIRSLGIL